MCQATIYLTQDGQEKEIMRDAVLTEVQLNTPLRPSPTPPLSQAEMAEIEAAFAGLLVVNVYTAQPPEVRVLDEAEMRRRRPAEGQPAMITR